MIGLPEDFRQLPATRALDISGLLVRGDLERPQLVGQFDIAVRVRNRFEMID